MAAIEHFWAVIPAGGSGTRLWPLSRSRSPKFLHDLTGSGRSLLQETADRLAPLAEDRLLVVTGARHRDAVLAQLPGVEPARVIGEPAPRESMAAIGYAAALLEREDPDAVMGSFAADHAIGHLDAFAEAVTLAIDVARNDWLVTIGIEPTRPATSFGYLRQGDSLSAHRGAFVVREFVEKPPPDVAAAYLASDDYRWNAGMFVVRPTVLLDLLATWHPDLATALRDLAADPSPMDEVWPGLTKIAIDHAVAEPAAAEGRVATVPADLGWDDIGDFHSLASVLGRLRGDGELQVLGDPGAVVAEASSGVVVPGGGRLVALVGVDDVVVVDTPDAVLVTTRDRAQDVKALVDRLRATGRTDLT
ncbi:MAG TPA: mannose-1-phosphate guanylyltransferase [Nocardioides sp.]|uniref:mannose-1-phosphate guanylyltransferase n=1 Tax=Nocardioides sp. TaxID=35761 RepID=UPI002F405DE0